VVADQANVEELKLQQLRAEKARLEALRQQIQGERRRPEQQALEQPGVPPKEVHHLDSYRLHTWSQLRDRNREGGYEAQVVARRQRVLGARGYSNC
jgi:hypothetical protein